MGTSLYISQFPLALRAHFSSPEDCTFLAGDEILKMSPQGRAQCRAEPGMSRAELSGRKGDLLTAGCVHSRAVSQPSCLLSSFLAHCTPTRGFPVGVESVPTTIGNIQSGCPGKGQDQFLVEADRALYLCDKRCSVLECSGLHSTA